MIHPIFLRGTSIGFLEFLIKEAYIFISDLICDHADGGVGVRQQFFSTFKSLHLNKFLIGITGVLLEQSGEVVGIQVEKSSGRLQKFPSMYRSMGIMVPFRPLRSHFPRSFSYTLISSERIRLKRLFSMSVEFSEGS